MSPKELAIQMLKPYIERGDTQEQTRAGQMGVAGTDGWASVGGYIGDKHYSSHFVIVTKLKDKPCDAVFKLSDIYDEVLSKQVSLL